MARCENGDDAVLAMSEAAFYIGMQDARIDALVELARSLGADDGQIEATKWVDPPAPERFLPKLSDQEIEVFWSLGAD